MKRKKKKKQLNLELLISATITLTIMFLIYASFWWSSYTRMSHLQQINISGYSIIPEKDHQIQLKSLMGIELEELNLREVSLLIESHPYVKAARVSRQYPATLSIEIVERQPVAILNVDPVLMIDREGIILPDKGQANDFLVPCLSGFNPAKELYPAGQQTVSVKVQETMNLITRILDYYPVLYSNISEVTMNANDEYVIILAEYPTKVILGNTDVWAKIQILGKFEHSLSNKRQLSDYKYLDLRYDNQVIAKERV
jgi:cell division protein FtsQ